jgi:putative membrane protein (TIGR04086 family)
MKKSRSCALISVKGVLLSIVLYVGIQTLLALLAVKSVLPADRLFPCQAASCAASVFLGSLFAARRMPMGSFPASMMTTGIFILFQIIIGLCFAAKIAWTGEGGGLLLAAAAGGVLAGVAGSKTVRRKKKRSKRGK